MTSNATTTSITESSNDSTKNEKKESVKLSVRQYSSVFSFNIIAEIAFGYKFDESSSNLYFKSLRDQVDALLNVKNRAILTFLPFLRYVPYIKDKLTAGDGKQILADVRAFLFIIFLIFRDRGGGGSKVYLPLKGRAVIKLSFVYD